VHNSIAAIGNLADTYPYGEATFRDMWGGAAGVRAPDFHLRSHLSVWKQMAVAIERLAANKSLLYGDGRLYAVLGLVYLALLYGFFARFLSRRM